MPELPWRSRHFFIFAQRSRREPWTSISKCLCVCVCVTYFQASDWSKVGDVKRRRQTLYDVARLLLMVPIELWQNSTPFLVQKWRHSKIKTIPNIGLARHVVTIHRASLTSTSLTTSSTYSSPLSLTYHHWHRTPLLFNINLSSLLIVDMDLPS